MDDRERDLDFLRRHASNAPATTRAPSRNPNHELVRAVVRGIGGPIKEELDKLRAENGVLRRENDALRAELRGEVAAIKGQLAEMSSKTDGIEREIVVVAERFGVPIAEPVPRRLS